MLELCVTIIFIIGKHLRAAWEVIIMDTDLHNIINKRTGERYKINGNIVIGHNNWLTTRCMILKDTKTPNYCILSAGTTLRGDIESLEYTIIGDRSSLKVYKQEVYLDINSFDV